MNPNSKRIAKNTLMLYFRMILIMGITLYTSRVVLKVLGIEDFGIYNVVGGVVAMFGFLNNSMAITTQRFINFEMGLGNFKRVNQIFSLSLILHVLIALAIFILAETVGIWFLNTKINIPPERMDAAQWIYHFSVLSAMITVIQVPYNAAIIAHERMNIYAYVSIIEAFLKLSIVFILSWFGVDKLKFYAILVFIVTVLITMTYRFYSKRQFRECTFRWFWNKEMFKDLFSQSSWNLLGTSANMLNQEGSKVVINIFFGVALNTASGIASQVSSAITHFVSNFLTAIRPQVVRLYAEEKMEDLYKLVYKGALFSFYLMFILSLPLLFQTETILTLWLGTVPPFTIIFTRLILIDALINTITVSLRTAIQASGKVKSYQILISMLLVLNIPISYLLFKLGFPPETIYLVMIVISIFALGIRVILLHRIIFLPIFGFISEVLWKIILVVIPVIIISFAINSIAIYDKVVKFIFVSVVTVFISIVFIYMLGLSVNMKGYINKLLCDIFRKYINR